MDDRELAALWQAQVNAPFPAACAGKSVEGIKLMRLDAVVADELRAAMNARASLSADQAAALDESARTLERVLPALDGDGRAYFERLRMVVRGVLERTGQSP